jgi:hypothetical protein
MKLIRNLVRLKIEKDFNEYYLKNDKGHRENHCVMVEHCANCINDRLNLKLDKYLIMLASWLHDIFAWNREKHHILIHDWINETNYPIIKNLSESDRFLLSKACLEHRASYQGDYNSVLSEVISSADRGFPITNIDEMLVRPIQFRMAQGINPKDAKIEGIRFLKEKYGSSGYARYPEIYLRVFEKELLKRQKLIDQY